MTGDRAPIEEYASFVEPDRVPLLHALDAAVRSAGEPLTVAVKYRLLMYTIDGKYGDWVCAIGPTKRTLSLRFLHGDQLDFGRLPARPGTTTMRTLDYTAVEEVDPDAIADLVHQAVAARASHRG